MDNIDKSIDATAVLYQTANQLLGLNNFIKDTFSKLYNDINKGLEKSFEECWKNIKKEYGDKVKKVKENFVKAVTVKVFYAQAYLYEQQGIILNPPLSEVVRYVFEYHYFHNSDLGDSERSGLQKDEQYQNQVATEICATILRESAGVSAKPVFTKYDPVIYTLKHLIDHYSVMLNIEFQCYLPKEEPDEYRLKFLLDLFINAFWKAENVMNQLVNSSPIDAIINWRTLFELGQIISGVIDRNYEFSKIYNQFERFAFTDDIDSNPELLEVMKIYADRYGKRVEDYGFRNYGWLTFIDESLPLNFKSVLKVNGCESHYQAYKTSSKFVHYRINPFKFDQEQIATFVITETFNSVSRITNAFSKFCKHYDVCIADEYIRQLNLLTDSNIDAMEKFTARRGIKMNSVV